MAKENKQVRPVVMDATGRGDFDTSGRGSMLGTLDSGNPNANPVVNQGSLRPMSVPPGPGGEAAPLGGAALGENVLETLFSGQELSEEFKQKASVLFETAVAEKTNTIAQQMMVEASKLLEQEVGQVVNELATKLDEYMTYVVEEWMSENKLAVESGIRTEIAESFMNGLRTLFETHYVEVPESKHDILEDLFAENQKLEDQLNEQIKNNVNLKKDILENASKASFLEATTDLSRVDAERLATLAENITFNTVEEFTSKLEILKENYLKAAPIVAKEPETLTEQRAPVTTDGPMSVYVNALTRQVKKV
jgi:hypothetical protein